MAKRYENRTFNVSVVGLSGTEKEKGVCGIGKSCLCNRFMRPLADSYYTDHISVLSQSDFGGRVVNNDHFLYWGKVTKTTDEGLDYTFQVVEQTEFIDDSSFQPFKSGKTEPYYKRCVATKLSSAEKQMYICKNQLGLELEYEEKMMPEGKLSIDGFLCLFDVSAVQQRSLHAQIEYTALILTNLLKTKKPVVLVTTKNDEVNDAHARELERMLSRKEFKNTILVVETSAHRNINVEQAFFTLAHLLDNRTKNRPKVVPYTEAAKARREILDVAIEAYQSLIRAHVTDYKTLWNPVYRKLSHNPDYIHFVEVVGTDEARKRFRAHVRQLREEFVRQKLEMYLKRLEIALKELLPDLITAADRSWPATRRWLQRHNDFDLFFVVLPEERYWSDTEFLEANDDHIPFDLLEGDNANDAEAVYRNHVNALRAEYKRAELKKQFKQLLVSNHNVCPGRSLSEVAIFFLGRECFSSLSEEDKHDIYEQHQRELREAVKHAFQELLLEEAELFYKFDRRQVMPEHLQQIDNHLAREPRYKALDYMEEERKVILLNHLGFMQHPSMDRCPFREACSECLIEAVLATKAHRPQSWSRNSQFQLDSEDNKLNLVILGNMGLADQLAYEIRLQCVDDEYTLDGEIYSLDYRPIDGDVSLPQNSFKTQHFLPHGCFCVFNCPESLEYIRCSLEKTLLSDLQRDDRLPFQGLPIVIVLAHDPEGTEKGLECLREEGQSLADRLQCPFIDIPSSMMVDSARRFHEDQIGLAMHSLVQSIKHRSSFVQPWQIAESIEPDIRVLMCFMCGDPFNVELPLGPLLNHQCCYVTSDKFMTITLETYLGDSKRKVEVTVISYHGASLLRDALFHGYILVYSAKRKASLATLSAFASLIPPVPVKILAVTESGSANAFFSSEHTQTLIMEGNSVADKITASFTTTCSNFQQQTASYTPFFKECWERKVDTESAYTFEETHPLLDMAKMYCIRDRPPAALPKPTPPKRFDSFGINVPKSSSNSQSTEDSDPIYDQPQFNNRQYHSDSEGERASSASPPPVGDSPFGTMEGDIYSEIGPHDDDTEQLIKPSQVKSRRTIYAEHYRKSYPSMSSSFASSSYREDSTDTDSSIRSPKLYRPELLSAQGEPHYQFRKSNSMKLALKETEEGANTKVILSDVKKRLLKASTLPSSTTPPDRDSSPSASASSRSKSLSRRSAGDFFDPAEKKYSPFDPRSRPPAARPKSRPKPLDPKKFKQVRKVLEHNIRHSTVHTINPVVAPLATPEPVEISEYAQVRDALVPGDEENVYASVADALPEGKLHRIRSTFRKQNHDGKDGSDSDSEFSSLEREGNKKEDIYSRVNRRPTPHKKKHKPRHSDSSLPPELPQRGYVEDMRYLVHADQLARLRSNSPSEGSEGTGDEQLGFKKQKKRRSLKSKKKKQTQSDSVLVNNPPWSDSEAVSGTSHVGAEDESREFNSSGRYEDEDQTDPGWMRKFKQKLEKDPDKVKRKEEKKAREEDRRRKNKEEEKRQKEQLKMQRKLKKKDGRAMSTGTPPQSCAVGPLEDMAQSEENLIPYFVEKCANFIEEGDGFITEGIYRVPGNKAHVDLLFEKFREDQAIDIGTLDIQVNAVATALKQFFNELQDPVIPSNLYEELVEAAGMPYRSARLLSIRGVLKKLPQSNYQVLRFIITHIYRISQHYSETSMDTRNLAICWSPTLLRPPITSLEVVTLVLKHLEEIVQMLIEQHRFLFYGENEV